MRKITNLGQEVLKTLEKKMVRSPSHGDVLMREGSNNKNNSKNNISETQYQNLNSSKQNFKTIDKLADAKHKAQHYSDQFIKQHQFNKEDEDEEANFLELCDVLNAHL